MTIQQKHRELWWEIFRDELAALHKTGFAYRAMRRPSSMVGAPFNNILFTPQGLRLIDVGISALRPNVVRKLFARFIEQEQVEVEAFAAYFLER